MNDISIPPPETDETQNGSEGHQYQLYGFILIQHDTGEQNHNVKDRPLGFNQKSYLYHGRIVNLTDRVDPTKRESQRAKLERYFLECVS